MTDADAPLSLEALLLLREGWDFEANTDGGVVVLGANERADGSVDTANSQQRRRNSEQSGPSSEQSSGVSSEQSGVSQPLRGWNDQGRQLPNDPRQAYRTCMKTGDA